MVDCLSIMHVQWSLHKNLKGQSWKSFLIAEHVDGVARREGMETLYPSTLPCPMCLFLCNILYIKQEHIGKCFFEFCEFSSKLIEPKQRVEGTPIYSQWVRSTGKTISGLLLASEGVQPWGLSPQLGASAAVPKHIVTELNWSRGHPPSVPS